MRAIGSPIEASDAARTLRANGRRRVLLITYHFPPDAGSAVHRALGLVTHLPKNNWDVAVIAPDHEPWDSVDPALLARVPADTPIFRAPYPGPRARFLVGPYACWWGPAWRAIAEAIETFRPDCIKTSSPPGTVNVLGYLAKKRYGLPWMASFRDPWVTGASEYQYSRLRRVADSFGEARTFAAADRICVNTPTNLEIVQRAYPRFADKMFFVTNGFDPLPARPADATAKPASDPITLLHSGSIYLRRDPRPIFRALKTIAETRPDLGVVRLKLVGRDDFANFDVKGAIRELGIEHLVDMTGHLPHSQTLSAMAEADALVVLHTPGAKGVVPAKLYEYLATGKPILALADTDADVAWVLRSTGISHETAGFGDPRLVEGAVIRIVTAIRSNLTRPGEPDKLAQFTRAGLARTLAGHLEDMVQAHAAGKGLSVPAVR
jgi:glycosyltransferase involved in cell wall biosynthesis